MDLRSRQRLHYPGQLNQHTRCWEIQRSHETASLTEEKLRKTKRMTCVLEHTDSGIQTSRRLRHSGGCGLFLNPIFHQRLPSSRSSIHHLTVPRPNIRTKRIVFNLWSSTRQLLRCRIRSKKAPTGITRACHNTVQSDGLKAKTTDRGASGLTVPAGKKHTDHI